MPLFFGSLYEGLSAGLRRDEALRQAQLACIRGVIRPPGRGSYRDSRYWAPVVCCGDPGRLFMSRGY